jgi:arabinogalactan endo-1,4-beta-galactosidase
MFGYLRVISVAHVIAAFFASQGSAASSVYHGHDISSMLMLEAAGQKYYFNGNQVPFDQIIHSAGADYIRSRIWVNPSDGNYNLNYNLALAKRAKALGLKFYLDFHYSGEHQLESYKQNTAPN